MEGVACTLNSVKVADASEIPILVHATGQCTIVCGDTIEF